MKLSGFVRILLGNSLGIVIFKRTTGSAEELHPIADQRLAFRTVYDYGYCIIRMACLSTPKLGIC